VIKVLIVLKSLQWLGKKKAEPKSELFNELIKIKGVGPEYAQRLVTHYKTKGALKKASEKYLKLMFPDHVAKKVIKYVKRM